MAKRSKPKSHRVKDGPLLVDRRRLASLMSVHPDTISKFSAEGMPVAQPGRGGREGLYDLQACLDWERENSGLDAKEQAQTRLYNENADIAAMKAGTMRQELFSRDQLVKEGEAFARAWAASLRKLPRMLINAGFVTREHERGVAGLIRQFLDECSRWKTQADLKRAERDAPETL